MITKREIDDLSYKIIGCAIEVHKVLGPGLLESIYHKCMKKELQLNNLQFQAEHFVTINYKNSEMDANLRCDLFINNLIVVELKAIDAFAPIHDAQLLSYMKLLNAPKGILINFCCTNIFNNGQKTMVNELYKNLPDK